MNWYIDDTGVDNNGYKVVSLSHEKFARQNNISRTGYLHNSYEFYIQHVFPLPECVIVPAVTTINHLHLMFGTDLEILLVGIINAISEITSSNLRISNIAGRLYKDLSRNNPNTAVCCLDPMIMVEQAGLDLRDILASNGFYIQNRWMPYVYESVLNDGALMLKRPNSFEDFCDTHHWAAGIDEYLAHE